ncbi:hypothetical protein [Billgrantia saliphila]|uniref:hypothetical protein n=1 Tax=Billgrantia saliphila TaxID=1848458 RepID=UPI000CE2F66F|nr:hypothetical protein [Halomonas saliphila]
MTSPSLPDAGESRFPRLRLMMLATLITLCVALWYLAAHLLRGDSDIDWYLATLPCDLPAATCSASLGGARQLTLRVDAPGGIRALEPLPLRVEVAGVNAQSVRVDLVGRDMDMGLHRFPLDAQDGNRFEGLVQVPICTESVMAWQAEVVVKTPDGRLGSRFDFSVERSGS